MLGVAGGVVGFRVADWLHIIRSRGKAYYCAEALGVAGCAEDSLGVHHVTKHASIQFRFIGS